MHLVIILVSLLFAISCDAQKKVYNNCHCGLFRSATRIVGGIDSGRRHPWQTGLFTVNGNSFQCGGSLITDRHILTAAHCLGKNTNPADYFVSIGKMTISDMLASKLPLERVTLHPDWNETVTFRNDIAILKLKDPVKNFGSENMPICLGDSSTYMAGNLMLTGWGFKEGYGTTPEKLQEITVKILPAVDCVMTWYHSGDRFQIHSDKQFCVGKPGRIACGGDSGSPLSTYVHGQVTQVGLPSFGDRACEGKAGGYTRVSYYLDFINQNTKGALWCA